MLQTKVQQKPGENWRDTVIRLASSPAEAAKAFDAGVTRGLGEPSAAWFALLCTPAAAEAYAPPVAKRVGSLHDTAAKF